jgi:hypothetical protein
MKHFNNFCRERANHINWISGIKYQDYWTLIERKIHDIHDRINNIQLNKNCMKSHLNDHILICMQQKNHILIFLSFFCNFGSKEIKRSRLKWITFSYHYIEYSCALMAIYIILYCQTRYYFNCSFNNLFCWYTK